MTRETAENWRREKKPSEFNDNATGYSYLSDDNIQMVEFHVDDHSFRHNVANKMWYGLMGGNLSVRKPELPSKPVMIFGQDESVSISIYSATDNGLDLKDSVRFFQRRTV